MMLPCLITHTLDVQLSGTDVKQRVIYGFGELLGLDRNSPSQGTGIAASIASATSRARA